VHIGRRTDTYHNISHFHTSLYSIHVRRELSSLVFERRREGEG
jgi:hypothetical protein